MTSDARTQPRADDEATAEREGETTPAARTGAATTDRAPTPEDAGSGAHRGDGPAGRAPRRPGLWIPLVAVLAVLLVVLLGAVGYLWFSRPAASSVSTGDYVGVLTQGRQDVVDLTSFDYQTIDQDIAQVRRISTGTLQTDSVALLEKGRQQFADQQVVVNTEVVSAAVTQAGDGTGRLVLVIQSTQTTKASSTPKVSRYRIQADLKKVGDRWLLTGITGR